MKGNLQIENTALFGGGGKDEQSTSLLSTKLFSRSHFRNNRYNCNHGDVMRGDMVNVLAHLGKWFKMFTMRTRFEFTEDEKEFRIRQGE